MKASDVMVTEVITVKPDSDVAEVAAVLLANRISAAPVVDDAGTLVGMISEGDLLRRGETGTGHDRSWWLRLLMGREILAAEFLKEHSRKVADLMTRQIVSAEPDMSVAEIATLLERHGIKRVPIVQNGKVVGIVSRATESRSRVAPQFEFSLWPKCRSAASHGVSGWISDRCGTSYLTYM
jgi:CBS domain-containing protein